LAGGDAFARGGSYLLGDGLALLGAVTYAVYVLASARVRASVPTSVQVAVLYGGCLVLLWATLAALGQALPSPVRAPHLWLAFVLMAIVPTTLGHTMVQSILDRVRPGVISVALLGEPVGASLLAWVFLHQAPSVADVAGGALALAGIAIALWPEGEPATPALAT
jgi:drug/metabolite transporter (DMT)-like permease